MVICRCVEKKTYICRYSRVLAPKNFLSTPEEVFGEGKLFDKEVEEKTRLAFRVTMKKLDKLNTLSEERREDLAREKIDQVSKYKTQIQISTMVSKYTQIQNTNTKIDQVVECFPNSLPEDLPKILGKTKWSMPAKEVTEYTWLACYSSFLKHFSKDFAG